MANELIVTNAAALAALVDKTTGDTLTAAEYTTLKDSLQEANAATRTANTVFAGPTTGAAAAPTFRALVAADIPSLSAVYQPLDATLTALAALGAGPGFLQVTGADTFSIAALSGAQVNTALGYTAANAAALNATNLTSGTVPDARFPATLPALNGSALTALNASNLGSGTIPDSRFPAVLPAISGANLTNLPGGVSGLTAGVIPVATSATAIANSKWTMTGTNLGTATLYDDTAVTGRSAIAIREGAGQSTDYTFAVVDNSNSTFYARLTGGAGAQFQAVAGFGDTVGGLRLTGNLLHLRSGGVINWNANAGDILGSPDTGLARAAAGILKITDGSTGFGNLSLGTRVEFGGDIGFTRWNSGLIAPITSGGSFAGLFVEQILGTDGAQQRFNLKANGTNPFLRFGSGGSVLWTSHIAENSATDDTGIVRAPIGGIVRATNGSTGDGGFQGVSLQGASSKALAAASSRPNRAAARCRKRLGLMAAGETGRPGRAGCRPERRAAAARYRGAGGGWWPPPPRRGAPPRIPRWPLPHRHHRYGVSTIASA
jgi:hypothetical protein